MKQEQSGSLFQIGGHCSASGLILGFRMTSHDMIPAFGPAKNPEGVDKQWHQ